VGAAAAILGVSTSLVRRACDDGRLPWWGFAGSNQRWLRRKDVLLFKEQGYVAVQPVKAQP